MSYSYFAEYYDALMQPVHYGARAEYVLELLKRYHHLPGLTLDLACGTGSFTLELKKRGVDIYGVDMSPQMLAQAQQKAFEQGENILFLCQKMQNIDLYGTVDTVVCTLDSLNHLINPEDLQSTFQRVALFLNPGGYFVFDMNTMYKHREVLANHTFVYDLDDIYCVWQNRLDPGKCLTYITLDLFAKEEQGYQRYCEEFSERGYALSEVKQMLQIAGLTFVDVFDDCTFLPLVETSERMILVARK